MQPFSVLITIRNRRDHLLNVIDSLVSGTYQPAEIVIVHMNEDVYSINCNIPLQQIELQTDEPLPLAAARNAAAKAAVSENLVFLDVDCIPAPASFELLLRDALANNAVAMVDPYYLSDPVTNINFDTFDANAKPNPARSDALTGLSDQYHMFWSLGFAVSAKVFEQSGGFDESFIGYGGEDTDFAFSLQKVGIPLYFSTAKVYHQPHASYDPPLNWFNDIISNARVFYKKWHIWPMEGWLYKFESMGLIERASDTIKVLREPTQQEVTQAERSAEQLV